MKRFLLALLSLIALSTTAQSDLTTSIRGTVVDKESQYPIPGVQVIVTSMSPNKGAASDENGNFRIEGVTAGRQNVEVHFVGYESQTFSSLLLYTNKDYELNIQLVESVNQLNTVEVVAKENKSESVNKMSTVSTRSFSMEEARRYSGTLQDPARMAQNFAGVSNASDDRNDIIIRGNSPTGVLWRLEGIDIPSPNHFATLGSTGGPVSMLNANNLANSDFSTGAFASEYGNALSGVFDLRLRSGNKDKREFMGQIGFNGFEFGAEGPFKKGGAASYVLNYRYSLLGALSNFGVNFGTGTAVPQYQDLTFKVDLPTKKAGKFTFFGIGGLSFIEFKPDTTESTNLYAQANQHTQWRSNTGITGASHTYFFNDKTYGKMVVALSTVETKGYVDSIATNTQSYRTFGLDRAQTKASAHYMINSKINAKNTLRAGLMFDRYLVSTQDSALLHSTYYFKLNDFDGGVSLGQAYAQWQTRPSDKWLFNLGAHTQYFLYNNRTSFEPRVSAKYTINPSQSISFGAGLHSQLQPITVYFNRQEKGGVTYANNKNLDFNKAAHFVLGYNIQLAEHMRFRTEVYYQNLYNVAVDQASSSFSMINVGADFTIPNNGNLVNNGKGKNMGVEFTLERFLDKGYYFLVTTSLFESKYKGSDQVWRNTAFNGNYVFNALAGKEWKVGEGNAITLDGKVTYAGGRWYAPIDLEASRAENGEVRDRSRDFSEQYSAYFRTDIKVGFRMNRKKYSQAISLDIRNVTNHKNVFMQSYDNISKDIKTTYQIGLFPMVLYNVWF